MANINKGASLSFTLPISCQICLGKVKQPVICPNQHVFCSGCMEVWLQRNKQCPTCRVDITRENPCRPILGGLSEQQGDVSNDFASRDMRRARMEMLFKDYEVEIDKLHRQNELLTEETRLLNERLSLASGQESSSLSHVQTADAGRVKLLTQKLEDATQLYDKVKREAKKLTEENRNLQELNGTLTIENKNLRVEMEHRSPRKFGRTAMSAMESRMGEYLKENTGLKKALERSDAYIEDLEKQLEQKEAARTAPSTAKASSVSYPSTMGKVTNGIDAKRGSTSKVDVNFDESESFLGNGTLDDSEVQMDRFKAQSKMGGDDDTFNLELPSPTTPKVLSRTRVNMREDTLDDRVTLDDTNMTRDETLEMPSPIQAAKKKLRFSETDNSDVLGGTLPASLSSMLPHTQKALQGIGDEFSKSSMVDFGRATLPGALHTQMPINHMGPSATSSVPANFTGHSAASGLILSSQSEHLSNYQPRPSAPVSANHYPAGKSSLNSSITPEMEDCMKLFEEAEKKVEIRKGIASSAEQLSTKSNLYRTGSVDTHLNGGNSALPPHLLIDSTRVAPNMFPSSSGISGTKSVPDFASSLPVHVMQNQTAARVFDGHITQFPSASGINQLDRLSTISQPSIGASELMNNGQVGLNTLPSGLHGFTSAHSQPTSLYADVFSASRASSLQSMTSGLAQNVTSLGSSLRMTSQGVMSGIPDMDRLRKGQFL